MNIQNFNNGQDLQAVRDIINTNFDLIQTAIEQVCDPSLPQVENPIRACLKSDFSNPCDGQNISFDLLKSISDQLNTALSVSCPSGSSLPACQAANGLATGVQSLVSNIATQIGSALSNNCPNGQTPSCNIYSPIGSGANSLIQNIVNNISNTLSTPCSASTPSCPIYAPLQAAKLDFAEDLIDTVFSSLNSVFSQNPCTLFNSQNLNLSGPYASCINTSGFTLQIGAGIKVIIEESVKTVISTISSTLNQNPCTLFNSNNINITGSLSSCLSPNMTSQIGSGVKQIINQVLSTLTQTVGNVMSATPTQLLNGQVFQLAGPLASCFSGITISLGTSFKSLIQDAVQTSINTVMSAIEDPCSQPTLTGPLSNLISVSVPSIGNLVDKLLSSNCIINEVIDFVQTNGGELACAILDTPTRQQMTEACTLQFVEDIRCQLFEKFIDTSGNEGDACIKDSILSFVDNNLCEFFEKFIDSSGNTGGAQSQTCVKDNILEFVNVNTCDLIDKINEGSGAQGGSYSNTCQSQFNTLIDSLLCEYTDHLIENQGIVSTNGTTPKYCVLNSANKVIEDYAELFFIVINGQTRQMRIPSEMKLDTQSGQITTQFYDVNGNKV